MAKGKNQTIELPPGVSFDNTDIELPPGVSFEKPTVDYDALITELEPIIQNSANPDEARAKVDNSALLSQELGIKPSQAYRNQNAIIEAWTGKKGVSAQTFGGYLKDKWTIGQLGKNIGLLGFSQMAGDNSTETAEKIADYQSQMPSQEDFKRALPARMVGELTEQIPIQLSGLEAGIKRGAATGAAFGLTALLLGQAGPQIATPEEILTVPAATALGLKLGMGSAMIENIGKIEAGQAYVEMQSLGIDDRIARPASAAVGVINMLLEMSQADIVLRGVSGPVKRLMKKSVAKATNRLLTSPSLIKALAKSGGKYAGQLGTEVAQEELQELTNIVFNEFAIEMHNRTEGNPKLRHEWEQALPRLKEIAIKSTEGFALMLLPGSVLNTTVMAKAALAEAQKSEALKKAEQAETEQAAQIGEMGKKEVTPEVTPKAKQPWEMTREEYARISRPQKGIEAAFKIDDVIYRTGPIHDFSKLSNVAQQRAKVAGLKSGFVDATGAFFSYKDRPELRTEHYESVKVALAEGKPVPAEVLADYPDLAGEVKPAVEKELPKAEKAPTEETPLDYVKERTALAEKVENVQEKARIQLGKAAVGQYLEQPATTREGAVHQAAKQIRDTRTKEYEAYKKDDFLNRLEAVGKIHTRFFKGAEEIQDIPVWVRMKVFTAKTGAMDIDEVANALNMTDNELIQKLKTYKGMEQPSTKIEDYYEEVERDYTIHEKVRVNEADLILGMKFTLEGEPYRVISKQMNKTTIKNHETMELDSFEDIDIDKDSAQDMEGNAVPIGKAITIAEKRIAEAAERGVTAGKAIGVKQEKARKKGVEARGKVRKSIKAYINKLVRRIAKPPSENTDLYYAQNIELIQEGLDPANRSKRTLRLRQKTREFLARKPEAHEYMPKKVLDLLDKKAANEMTVEELESMDSEIALMRKLGRNKYKSKQDIKRNVWTAKLNDLLGSIMGGDKFVAPKEEHIGRAKGEPIRAAYYLTLIPQSLFDLIDGGKGTYGGSFYNTYYNEVNNLTNQKKRHMDERKDTVKAELDALGITINDLMKRRQVGDKKHTVADMIGIYGLSQNKLSFAALIYGVFGDYDPFVARDKIKAIRDALTDNEKKAAKIFMNDFETNYQRLREAFIEYKDRDLGHEDYYLPMFRTEVTKDMLDEQMAEELLNRENLKKAYAPKGFTIERVKDIPSEYQKPIKTNIVEIWADAIQREEHFIAFAEKIRDLQKFNKDEPLRSAIQQRFGRSMMERVQNYTNAIASPTIYKQFNWFDKYGVVMRRHASLAYLAYNTVTMGKQVPSLIYYMSKAGPSYLTGSMLYCATHPGKALEFVNQDKQMEHRSIERELEELKRFDKTAYERIINKIGKIGFYGIRTLDKMVTTIGYVAVYTKHIDMGYSDQKAREVALNTTLRTQPAAAAKDIAEIYRTHESLNMILQFTNQINKIWNISVYDIPAQVKNHKYYNAMLALTSVVVGQIFIWSLAHRRFPDDEDDIKDALSENSLNMVPVIGKIINAARSGWKSSMPAVARPIEAIGTALSEGASARRRLNALIESIAVGLGLPYIAGKRVVKTLAEKDLTELVGGPPRK